MRFGGGRQSGINKVVGDRGTLIDGAETGTLGEGAVYTGTLGGAEGTGAGRATCVDGGTLVACWLAWSKIQANLLMAWIWASLIWAKGDGMGLVSASVRLLAALKEASAEEHLGTGQLWGKKFNSFDDAFSSGFRDVHSVAPVVFRDAVNVPPGDAMG